MNYKKSFKLLRLIICFSLLFAIFKIVNWQEFIQTIKLVKTDIIIAVAIISCGQIFCGALRWHIFNRDYNKEMPLLSSIKITWATMFLAQILPGGVVASDVLKCMGSNKICKNANAGIVKSTLLDKFYTILPTLLCAIPYFLGAKIWFFVLAAIFLGSLFFRLQIKLAWLLTIITLILTFTNYYLCLSLFLPVVPKLLLWQMIAPMILFSMLPISIGSIGIKEGATIYFLTQLSITNEAALSISLMLSFVALFVTLPGFFVLTKIGNNFQFFKKLQST